MTDEAGRGKRRWRVTETYRSPMTFFGPLYGLPPEIIPAPVVRTRDYRWRWRAALNALVINLFNAFHPGAVFGFWTAEVATTAIILNVEVNGRELAASKEARQRAWR